MFSTFLPEIFRIIACSFEHVIWNWFLFPTYKNFVQSISLNVDHSMSNIVESRKLSLNHLLLHKISAKNFFLKHFKIIVYSTINWTKTIFKETQKNNQIEIEPLNASHYILHRKRSPSDCFMLRKVHYGYTHSLCSVTNRTRQMCEWSTTSDRFYATVIIKIIGIRVVWWVASFVKCNVWRMSLERRSCPCIRLLYTGFMGI